MPIPVRLLSQGARHGITDRKSTRLNSSHLVISYAVFCLKKKKPTSSPKTWVTTDDILVGVLADSPHCYRPCPFAPFLLGPRDRFSTLTDISSIYSDRCSG